MLADNNAVLRRIPGDSQFKCKQASTHNSDTDDDSFLLGCQNHLWRPDY